MAWPVEDDCCVDAAADDVGADDVEDVDVVVVVCGGCGVEVRAENRTNRLNSKMLNSKTVYEN